MKRIIFLIIFILSITTIFAQDYISPSFDVTLEREIDFAAIEDKVYTNIIVEINSAKTGAGVKVTIKDASNPNTVIYKKNYSKSYLYGDSDGSIIIAQGNILVQLVILKDPERKEWKMQIKEKGIY